MGESLPANEEQLIRTFQVWLRRKPFAFAPIAAKFPLKPGTTTLSGVLNRSSFAALAIAGVFIHWRHRSRAKSSLTHIGLDASISQLTLEIIF